MFYKENHSELKKSVLMMLCINAVLLWWFKYITFSWYTVGVEIGVFIVIVTHL